MLHSDWFILIAFISMNVSFSDIVAGVTTPSRRVAHALGLQWWIEYKTL